MIQAHNVKVPSKVIQTWAVTTSVSTWSSLPQKEQYKIVKAATANKEDLEKAYPRTKEYNYVEDTIQKSTIPLAAGTVQYLKEKGVKVPDRLIPPVYKSVS